MKYIKATACIALFLISNTVVLAQMSQTPGGLTQATIQSVNDARATGSAQASGQSSALGTYDLDADGRALLAYTTIGYPVTPGDSYLLVFLRGATSDSVVVTVGTDYSVNMGVFGIVSARGQTFDQFRRSIEHLVSVAYPGSMPQLLIKSTGVFNVLRLGETSVAGEFSAWGLARLSSLYAVSRTPYSSLRSIAVRSADGVERTYDLFKAQRDGDLSQDPYLKPGDTITLSRYDRSVTIKGKVYRPGTYQLLPGEKLSDLVQSYAMGFIDRADLSRIVIERISDGAQPMGTQIYGSYADIREGALANQDTVTVGGLDELLPVVWFDGALGVTESGANLEAAAHMALTFMPGERLSTAIQKIRDRVGPASALDEAYIRRGDERIPVNLGSYLYDKDFSVDHALEPNDTIVIPFKQLFVTVSGAVRNPGRYPYITDRTWDYYVALAGGLDMDKNSFDAVTILDRGGRVQPKSRIIQPEDMITAKYNSVLYQFGRVSTILSAALSVASIVISVLSLTN